MSDCLQTLHIRAIMSVARREGNETDVNFDNLLLLSKRYLFTKQQGSFDVHIGFRDGKIICRLLQNSRVDGIQDVVSLLILMRKATFIHFTFVSPWKNYINLYIKQRPVSLICPSEWHISPIKEECQRRTLINFLSLFHRSEYNPKVYRADFSANRTYLVSFLSPVIFPILPLCTLLQHLLL